MMHFRNEQMSHFDPVMGSPSGSPCSGDGTYRYCWSTQFGGHTVYYRVIDGIIQDNPANESSPIKQFVGKTVREFSAARLTREWKFKGDSFHQMTSVDNEPHRSIVLWPDDVSTGKIPNESTDEHPTKAHAEAVCRGIEKEGFGGKRKIFPLSTRVEKA